MNYTDEFGDVAGCSESVTGMFYLVNLSERTVEHESNTRAGCVSSRKCRETQDALRDDMYAQRLIVAGLTRDEIDDMVQSDPMSLYPYEAGGGR